MHMYEQIQLYSAASDGAMTRYEDRVATDRSPSGSPRNLWETGFLVSLEVHYWTGKKILKPEDLGLKPNSLPELYSLGRKLLVPKEVISRFRALEERARYTLEQNTFQFPIGNLRFAPVRTAKGLFASLDEIIREFREEVERFLACYGMVWDEMEPRYREAAALAYRIARPNEPEWAFTEKFLARVRQAYPPASVLAGKFSMRYHAFQITSPEISRLSSTERLSEIADELRNALRKRVEEFVDQAAQELRSRVVETCTRVAEMIRSGQVVREQSLESLRKMVQDFRMLNFVEDREVEMALVDLEWRYLNRTARSLRETGAIDSLRQALDAIADTARSDVSTVTGQLKRKIIL